MSGFSEEWERVYQDQRHLNKWPWSDLVSYVMRFSRPSSHSFRVLELGCGSGPNIPFFLDLNVEYYGCEGSVSVVKLLHEKYPEIKERIQVADFTKEIPFSGGFDLIFDRGSLTHNSTEDLSRCCKLIHSKLKNGGKFIGIDWFSTLSSEYHGGDFLEGDINTLSNIRKGRVANLGRVHFADEAHLRSLFRDFKFSVLEQKLVLSELPVQGYREAFWNFVVEK